MKRRKDEAEMFNTELVQMVDQLQLDSAVAQQVELIGSHKLYERINHNLKISKFEAHFAKVRDGPVHSPLTLTALNGLFD